MKKLLIATVTLAAAALVAPSLVSQSQAAPAQNPYCKLVSTQKNPVAWNAYYGCLRLPARATKVSARTPARRAEAKSPYCKMASAQKNPVAWNAYYHCLSY